MKRSCAVLGGFEENTGMALANLCLLVRRKDIFRGDHILVKNPAFFRLVLGRRLGMIRDD